MSLERKWQGRWINAGKTMVAPNNDIENAPLFRKTFICEEKPEQATLFLCGLGWHVLYINSQKADDRVLAPTVTQFDKHVSFIEYDITGFLKKGKNSVVVLLGNGLFNCRVPKWGFDKAPWRDHPKMLCDITVDGKTIAKSGTDWKMHDSPVTYNELRNGQYYDARLEIPGFADPDYDDSNWKSAALCTPPGGRIIKEMIQPCKVMQSYPAVSSRFVSSLETTYDFGTNLTGWCRIRVKGEAGAKIKILYAEQVDPISGHINRQEIAPYENFGPFQTDEYILKGDPDGEEYEPFFTYHGFRYAQTCIFGNADLLDIQAQFVHTAFSETGQFESSDTLLNTLQRNTVQSYKSNFTGIPTDCPHREKNGWTGDAAIAAETGLWNFDMEAGYSHFLRIVADTQRVNGQLPGIAPTAGYGFNWGGGPAWDTILFEYPYLVYLFYGKKDLIEQYYDCFTRYLEYCSTREEEDGLLNFGLGDWCHWDSAAAAPVEVTSSVFYYQNLLRTAFFANLLGIKDDAVIYQKLAAKIRNSFIKKFANEDGTFADRSLTATASALYFNLAEEDKTEKSIRALVQQVREQQHKANFGILGAKYIPRVLAEYGYADDALEIITQKEFPGWGWQVEQGATSLWENWNGRNSQNHIMFGDISAWMYQYPGGIRPAKETPGFRKFAIKPCFVKKLDHVKTAYRSLHGLIKSEWIKKNGNIYCEFEIPASCRADIILPQQTIPDASGIVKIDFPERGK